MPSYLGIDASLEGTGLVSVSETGFVTRMETVRVPHGVRGMARLALIEDRLVDFLSVPSEWDDPVKFADRVRYVAIEGYAYNAVNQAFSLGEIGGVLRLRVHRHAVPYTDVPPASLKKYATGSSEADKAAMVAAAVAAGAATTDHNQADAYFLACIALALEAGPPRERAKMEVVRSLTHPALKKARPRPRRLVKNPV